MAKNTTPTLSEQEKTAVRHDYLEWSGGFSPVPDAVATYIKATLSVDLQPKADAVRQFLLEHVGDEAWEK